MTLYPALEKLLELSEKATPEPWHSHNARIHAEDGETHVADFWQGDAGKNQAYANAEFCKKARNAIPELRALLADVREREAVIEEGICCNCEGSPNIHQPGCLFYTSPPSQQAVDVEEAAEEIMLMLAPHAIRELALREKPELVAEQIRAILRKHLVSPREGSSKCPICGVDTPHYHSPEEQAQHNERVKSASLKQIEAAYPDMVMVPREPTEAMLEAGHATFDEDFKAYDLEEAGAVYKAMIAAASPPLAPKVGEK